MKALSEHVIGCAYEVSNVLGAGFLEKVYENALCIELERLGVSCKRQSNFDVNYKGAHIGCYIADIVVGDRLLVELKALSGLTKQHEAQVMNYLKASGLSVGLLINFGTSKIVIKRIVWQHDESEKI